MPRTKGRNARKLLFTIALLIFPIILFVGGLAYANTVILTWATVGTTPSALAFDSSGNLYVANAGSGTISKITSGGGVTLAWATVGTSPVALAFDSSGNLYVANSGSTGTISKITSGGSVTLTWASVGPYPNALAFDSSGNLYVANAGGGTTISKITPGGSVTLTWATVGSNPYALAFDSSGNLYVANYSSGTISKITSGGSVTLTWATIGTTPVALAFDSSGNLYVTNRGSDTVSKIIFPPGAPGRPTFSSVTSTSLTVSWTAPNATSSNLYRCSGASCTPTLYQSGITSTSYNDTGLTPNTWYTYYIVGANSSGTGPASASNWTLTYLNTFGRIIRLRGGLRLRGGVRLE